MSTEMERASEALREARYDYETAEHNLAVARAKLTKAERWADGVFRKMFERSEMARDHKLIAP